MRSTFIRVLALYQFTDEISNAVADCYEGIREELYYNVQGQGGGRTKLLDLEWRADVEIARRSVECIGNLR